MVEEKVESYPFQNPPPDTYRRGCSFHRLYNGQNRPPDSHLLNEFVTRKQKNLVGFRSPRFLDVYIFVGRHTKGCCLKVDRNRWMES